MLGTGLIGLFYTVTLHGQRNRDRVEVVYSRSHHAQPKDEGTTSRLQLLEYLPTVLDEPPTEGRMNR